LALRRLLQALRGRTGGRPVPAAVRTPVTPPSPGARSIEAFGRAAEAHWQAIQAEPSALRSVSSKPFSGVGLAPGALYRLGLVLSELRAGLGHVVLDFGAGSCWLSLCLNRLGCRTVSVDVSPTALSVGRRLFELDPQHRPELVPRFLVFDGHWLPLADASVDRVVCFDAFHHAANPEEVLGELCRVLRPGGRVVMAEPGEGHAHSDTSSFDSERYGVFEGEIDPIRLERQARDAGFSDVRLKPYPEPDAMSVSVSDYVRLMNGDARAFPLPALQASLRLFFVVTLSKGDALVDSRRPGRLLAEIRRREAEGPLSGSPGSALPLGFRIRNLGDTVWLCAMDPIGGYVSVAGDLIDASGRVVVQRFFSNLLPRPVAPGESVDVDSEITLPFEPGEYRIRVDLVDEHVMWFAQAGSSPLEIPLRVDAAIRPDGADGHRARIESRVAGVLEARAGTRVVVPLRLSNLGREPWPAAAAPAPGTISLAARIFGASGQAREGDLLHLVLPDTVPPGGSLELDAAFEAPLEPGRYTVHLDMVMELRFWFAQRGSEPLELRLDVSDELPDSADPGLLRAVLALAGAQGDRLQAAHVDPLSVRVTNVGNTLWLHDAPAPRGRVGLGVHVLEGSGGTRRRELQRVPLPRDVRPGESVELRFTLEHPLDPGTLAIELDLVDEGFGRFGERGSPTLVLRLDDGECS
jgi:SAM-dependent methyltransferase